MKSVGEIYEIRNFLYAGARENVKNLAEVKAPVVAALGKKSEEACAEAMQGIITDVKAVLLNVKTEDNVGFPDTLNKFYYTPSEDGVKSVDFRVSSKLKSTIKFSEVKNIPVDENLVLALGDFYITCMLNLFDRHVAEENLQALNAKVAEMVEDCGLSYAIEFACDTANVPVVSVSDSKVVFNVSVGKAFGIAALPIFASGDNYNDYIAEHAVAAFKSAVSAVQTPVQLIKAKKVDVIRELTDLTTKKRASKLIRMAYHRQAKYLGGIKAGIGYFDETVKVAGADVDVFALVEKAEDGSLSVVLSPFDAKTNMVVDFDVVSAVKEQLAANN